MAIRGAGDVGPSKAATILFHDGSGSVLIPEPETLFLGDYARHGSDLVITHDGAATLVLGYFGGTASPNLSAPNGAYLTPEVVSALAGPLAPGQYAQLGGQAALVEIGKILTLTGTAEATRADGVKVSLTVGDVVYQGDVVQTGPDSKLGVSFLDDSLFSMSANGRMVLNELVYDPAKAQDSSMVINLVQGSFVFVTGAIAPTGNMKIETPVATMGIRGTTPKVVISSELGVTEFSILPDPDSGKVGSYVIIDKSSGEILGTVESVGDKWVVNTLSNEAVKIAKSGLDLLEDEIAMSDIREVVSHALGDRTQVNGPGTFQQVSYDSNAGTGGDESGEGDGSGGQVTGGDQNFDDPTPDVDDPPVANDDTYAVHEDTPLIEDVIGLSKPGGTAGKDFDPDGFNTLLAVTEVNGQPLVFNSAGLASVVLPADAADQTVGANLLIRASGAFTYDPSSAFDFLAAGEFRTETFTYTLRDKGGYTDTATVTITIEGRNDTPVITAIDVEGTIFDVAETDPTQEGVELNTVGSVTFSDVDLTNRPVATEATKSIVWLGQAGQPAPPELTTAQKAAIENAFTITNVAGNTNNGTVTWDYTINENMIDFLGAGEKVVVVFTITVDDGYTGTNPRVGTTTQDVTITIFGATEGADNNDAPVITVIAGDADTAGLTETNATLSVDGTLTVTEVDLTDEIDLSVVSVTPSGTGPLLGQPDNATLKAMLSLTPSPILADTSTTQTQFSWYFDSDVVNFDYLSTDETLILTYVVRATDDQDAFDDQTVTITITGTNDAPVIAAIDQADLNEQTDTAALTTSISVTFGDVDLTDVGHTATVKAAVASGVTTGLALDEAALIALVTPGTVTKTSGADNGAVTLGFSAASTAFDYLSTDEVLTLTYTLEIDDLDPDGKSEQTFVVTITGTNDAPVIAAIDQADLNEQTDTAALTTSISVTFGDVDLTDVGHTATVKAAVASGVTTGLALDEAALIALVTPGTVTKTSGADNGAVTLGFSAASTAFDYLSTDEVLTLTYTLEIDDLDPDGKSEQTFVVTITGTNDAPVIAAIDQADLDEQTDTAALTTSISVTFGDVDLTDVGHTATVKAAVASGVTTGLALDEAALIALVTPGTVTKTSGADNGAVTLGFSAASTAFDYLSTDEVLTLTYTLEIDDLDPDGKSEQTFVVTITGTNDAPVIAAIDQADLDEQTDTAALTTSISVTFGDVDLTDVGHTATVKAAVASGVTTGLALDEAALIALVTPGTVTKTSGADNGAVTLGFSAASTAFDYLSTDEVLTLTYTLEIDDLDPDGKSEQTFVVTITGTNDAPVIAAIDQADLNEQTDTAALTTSISVTFGDVDLTDVGHTATVKAAVASGVTTGLALDEAALIALVTPGTVTKTSGADNGAVTLGFSAASTAFDYLSTDEVLTLTYTLEIDDLDPDGKSEQTFVVTITGTNDAPVIAAIDQADLNEQTDTAALTTSISVTFGDVDLTDVGHTATVKAAVASGVTTGLALDEAALIALVTPGTVTKTSGADNGAVTLGFSAASTAFDYLSTDEVLTLTYTLEIDDLDPDGKSEQTFVVTITGTNDAPVVTAGTTLAYGWNDGAKVIDASVTVADIDNAQLVGATVSIGTGYVEGEDFLGFVDGGGITGLFNAATGVLELSGTATKAAYEAALRSVTYLNIAEDPSPDDRTISFSVDDGEDESLAATSTVSITPFVDVFGDEFANSNLEGTAAANRIYGFAENDNLFGLGGNDQLFGDLGNDDLFGGEGDDLLDGGEGDDYLEGGAGTDRYVGGDGAEQYDTISFENETGTLGVVVNLAAGTATDTYGNNETLSGIEDIAGSNNDDTLIGDHGDNFFRGFDGSDSYDGGGGTFDQVSYDGETGGSGAFVDLGSVDGNGFASGTDTYGNAESFKNIEVLRGSQYGDHFIGDAGNNTFRGMAGNDTLNGGDGFDAVRYDRDASRGGTNGVTVNLALGTATDGFGDTDTLISIESVRGSQYNDTLIGDDQDNEFIGLGGNDFIEGGGGSDWAGYWPAESGILVDMRRESEQVVDDGLGGTDTLASIEGIVGSTHDDTVVGNWSDNWYDGHDGNDRLIGGAGNEWLYGGDGNDKIDGGIGYDYMIGGAGADTFYMAPGTGQDEIEGFNFADGDRIDIQAYGYTSVADIGANGGSIVSGADTVITFGSGEQVTLYNFDISTLADPNDAFIFSGSPNVVQGTDDDDLMFGISGNDVYLPMDATPDGGDEIYASLGSDQIDFAGSIDGFYGMSYWTLGDYTDLTVTIGATSGTIVKGSYGTDTLSNLNLIDGNLGGLGIFAGYGGNDSYVIDASGVGWIEIAVGGGNDTLDVSGSGTIRVALNGYDGVTVNANLATGTVQEVGGTSTLDVTGFVNQWRGTSSDDSFVGTVGNEHFITDRGDDIVDGGGGFDTLRYDRNGITNLSVVYSAQGAATVSGIWDGQAFTDMLTNVEAVRGGRIGTTEFIGSAGEERFDARGGFNYFEGRGGADTLSAGGDGNLFSFGLGSGIDEVNDFLVGRDKIDVSGYGFADESDFHSFTSDGTDTIIDLNAASPGDDVITLYGVDLTAPGVDLASVFIFDATVISGTSGNDVLAGNSDANTIEGLGGSDTLYGFGDDDILIGGDGSDVLFGGSGMDEFRFSASDTGVDEILDFSEEDFITLHDFGPGAVLSLNNSTETSSELQVNGTTVAKLDYAPNLDFTPSISDFDVAFVDDHYVVSLMTAGV